jgi:hypothetical protein
VIDGQVGGRVGGTLVARAPVALPPTPGAEHTGTEPLPGRVLSRAMCRLRSDCRACSVQRLPARLVATPGPCLPTEPTMRTDHERARRRSAVARRMVTSQEVAGNRPPRAIMTRRTALD